MLQEEKRSPAHCVCVDCEEGWPYEQTLQRVIQTALEAEGVDVPCVVEAVSYTHLDVYKRQPLSPPRTPRPSSIPWRRIP